MAEAAQDESPAPSSGGKSALLLPLLNTLVILGVLGLLVYTRLIFKRPVITESAERARLASLQEKPAVAPTPGTMSFESVTVNIAPTAGQPKGGDATLPGKPHFVTLAFTLELKDMSVTERLEALRPVMMDKILHLLGGKSYQELTTVQGRYVLRTQILEIANEVAKTPDPVATNVFFSTFMVQ